MKGWTSSINLFSYFLLFEDVEKHTLNRMCLFQIYKFYSTMQRIVHEFFFFFGRRSSFRINAASFVSLQHSGNIDN